MPDMLLQNIPLLTSTTNTDVLSKWIDSFSIPWLQQELIGMEYWRWGAVIVVIAVGFTVDLIVRTILRSVLRSITHSDSNDKELVQILKYFQEEDRTE